MSYQKAPAFPRPTTSFQHQDGSPDQLNDGETGMDMLDYFAGQALDGIMASRTKWAISQISDDVDYFAGLAYGLAEAMCKEAVRRDKEG